MRKQFAALRSTLILATCLTGYVQAAETPAEPMPPFAEVYSLIRSNLIGATDAELNRAAVVGFLSQLQPRVTVVTNTTPLTETSAVPLLSKATVFDREHAFLRVGRVAPGLAKEIQTAYTQLASTNRLEGLVLDVRYAGGTDYAAAAEAADLFLMGEQPLLSWGSGTARSTPKTKAIDLPVVILMNGETTGAAEALAAALREAGGALVIGSPSAGRAYLFREIPLTDRQTLRVASGLIAVGQNRTLPETGVVPDIRITVNPDHEKAYFEDPYAVLAKPFAQAARAATNDLASLLSTNRARRRVNEAELVRMQREGMDFEGEQFSQGPPQATGPVIHDPALSRGLDLLKGLAITAKRQ